MRTYKLTTHPDYPNRAAVAGYDSELDKHHMVIFPPHFERDVHDKTAIMRIARVVLTRLFDKDKEDEKRELSNSQPIQTIQNSQP